MSLEKAKSIEADLQSLSSPAENISVLKKISVIFSNITVEPVVALYILPSVIAILTTQNLNLEKACRVNLQYDPAICDALTARNKSGYAKIDEINVQKLVAKMAAYKTIIQSVVPAIILLFIGAWSDRHKRRKPCIFMPMFGDVIQVSGYLLCTYFFYELGIEYNVFFEAVPQALCGGWFLMFMGVFSYISSISTVETRTLRIGAVNLFANISITIGMALSGVLFKAVHFYGVYTITLIMYVIGSLYIAFVIKEVPLTEKEKEALNEKHVNPVIDFFSFKHVIDTFKGIFKNDRRNKKMRVITIMLIGMVIIGPTHGEMSVAYLYVRYKFNWNAIDYSMYTTFHFVFHFLGVIFSLSFFTKFLKVDDTILGMISCASKIAACVVYCWAPSTIWFYTGAVVEVLSGTSHIALRSIMSKLVEPEELGKMSALFGVAEALTPVAYGPLYSWIYRTTVSTMPGSFYLVGAGLMTPSLLLFLWLYCQSKQDQKEAKKEAQEKDELLKNSKMNENQSENKEQESANLIPCQNCGRTFYPDRLLVHQRSCKEPSINPSLVPCNSCGRTFYPDRLIIHQKSCKGPSINENSKKFEEKHNENNNITFSSILKKSFHIYVIKMTLEKSKSIEAELQTVVTGTENDTEENISFGNKLRIIFTNITVEPTLVLYVLPSVMASLATQNLSLEKACRVNLRYDPEICDALSIRNRSGYNQTDEENVQKLVATMAAYKNIVQSTIPALLLLFVGSWSDRHKRRKPCILIPIFGEVMSVTGFMICTYFFNELSLEYNTFFEAVPPAITGGWFVMFMGVFSYISTITSVKTRTLRIGAVNVFSNISITIGMALSGILYQQLSFYGVFTIALGMYITSIIYTCFGIKEIPNEEKNEPPNPNYDKPNMIVDFFNYKYISETFVTVFKNDKKHKKARIIIVLCLAMVIIGPLHGEMNVNYLYVRYKFGWNEMDYSMYTTFHFVFHFFGVIFSLSFFSKYLKVDDSILGMISCSSKIAACMVYTFAPTTFYFYVGAVVEILNGTSFIALRSIMSKLVRPNELGKINALFGVAEAFTPLVYGPLYSKIYRDTLNTLPGSFFLVGGILTSPALIMFFWLYRQSINDKEEAKLKAAEELLNKVVPQHENIHNQSIIENENKDKSGLM